MARFSRFRYQPVLPLGKDGRKITACAKHLALSKEVAVEGTVLLKNDGTLPLKKGSKVCLFGRGAGEYILGGSGSGGVNTDKKITLADALRAADAAGELNVFLPVIDDAEAQVKAYLDGIHPKTGWGWELKRSWNTVPMSEDLYRRAVEFGGTAIFSVLRPSSESYDRSGSKGDFLLYDEEAALLDQLTKDFEKVVVILCTPGPVETKLYAENPKVNALLYPMYGGSFAGSALVDILLGKRYPSGHLQDTLAAAANDYPGTESFNESDDYVNYTEDIFVGYRYFETFCPEKVVYPFGFGLGYTTFDIATQSAELSKNTVTVKATVTNTGSFAGKEVVQLYLTAPQGKLGKAKKVLTAFAKTKELKPGECQDLTLRFDLRQFASFDDLGKVAESCFVLEKGEYTVSMGVNVRDTSQILAFDWAEDTIVRRCKPYMAPDPKALPQRLTASGKMEALRETAPMKHPSRRYILKTPYPENPPTLAKALESDRLDELLATLEDEDIGGLLYGHINTNASQTCSIGLMPPERRMEGQVNIQQIPAVPTCDGPAGYRSLASSGVYTTYFPCANTVSQTWSLKLAERIGKIGALEVKENNCGIWLTPALNIHRSPLCGRNFEYYSEDPLTSGLFAAATVNGIQSQSIAATVKHFCGNNKEVNRRDSDSRISQRALREIYLRGFEICVKKANPWCLMTSYNLVNGVRCSGHWELINGILKGEWKYPGVVMTDWHTHSLLPEDLMGGNDVRMPYRFTTGYPGAIDSYDPVQAIREGELDRGVCMEAVRRILSMMGHFE